MKMNRPVRTLGLMVAVLQMAVVAASAISGRIAVTSVECQELLSQVDETQRIIEEFQQNQSLSRQAEALFLEEIFQLNSKLQDSKLEAENLTAKISEVREANLYLVLLNQKISKVVENLQGEVEALNSSLTVKTAELRKANLDLVILTQNTNKSVETLQRGVAALNLSLTNKIEETAELRKHHLVETEKAAAACYSKTEALNATLSDEHLENSNLRHQNADLTKRNMECVDQNRNLTEITGEIRNEVVALRMEQRKNELQIQNLTGIYTLLEERNSELAQQNVNLTTVCEFCREENLALSLKTQEKELNIINLTDKIRELQQELRKYCNVNVRDADNYTPLIRAARNNQTLTVKSLIDLGADLDAQNKNKETALFWAADKNNTEMCKMLVEAEADVNVRNYRGTTALNLAAYRNNLEVVAMLVGNGAKVNLANINRRTPLHYAANQGQVEVAKLLVRHGANINAKDVIGRTPLKFALDYNKPEVATYLRSVGGTV